jgi:hypothetical protein
MVRRHTREKIVVDRMPSHGYPACDGSYGATFLQCLSQGADMIQSAKAVKALFGVAVAASLAFGATDARATVRTACSVNYGTGHIGSCLVQEGCDARCMMRYPGSPGGWCVDGCCTCQL